MILAIGNASTECDRFIFLNVKTLTETLSSLWVRSKNWSHQRNSNLCSIAFNKIRKSTDKGGINKSASDRISADGSPDFIRRGCEASLQRLKTDRIALYQLHRPDPKVPFAESVGMLATLQKEGKVRLLLCPE